MKNHFTAIMNTKGVQGIVFFTDEGAILFESFQSKKDPEIMKFDNWESVAGALRGIQEADIIFDSGRFYIRRSDTGIILVVLDLNASTAMIKLNCDIILPNLKKGTPAKGLKRFFIKQ